MVSNSLSLRRDLLARPIVCRKGPPPIPPIPPPVVTCEIEPATVQLFVFDPFANATFAHNEALPLNDPVTRELSATGGTFQGNPDVLNGVWDGAGYDAPGTPGVYTLKAVFTFSDATICIAFATYTVVDF